VAVGRVDEAATRANVGRRIAELRERSGLTQAEFAERLAIEPRNAQRLEASADLKLSTLVRVANALDVALRDLFLAPRRGKRGPGRPALWRRRSR
jgi:transcriptional regulator with XRE-family HTH domain